MCSLKRSQQGPGVRDVHLNMGVNENNKTHNQFNSLRTCNSKHQLGLWLIKPHYISDCDIAKINMVFFAAPKHTTVFLCQIRPVTLRPVDEHKEVKRYIHIIRATRWLTVSTEPCQCVSKFHGNCPDWHFKLLSYVIFFPSLYLHKPGEHYMISFLKIKS